MKNNDLIDDWEDDAELFYSENWNELLKLRLNRAKKNPKDLYAQYYLGEAYFLNKKYNEAIILMYEWHKRYPLNIDFSSVILDSLFALGKNENDIEWIIKPKVIRITTELLDKCFRYLKRSRNKSDIHDLYNIFLHEEYKYNYFAFSKNELMKSLKNDDRFQFTNNDSIEIIVTK